MSTLPPPDGRAPAGARVLEPSDAEYPAGLRDLRHPPARLYVRGAGLPVLARGIAMVGSRAATPDGHAFAERLAADLAGLGFVIVSGLARGIDAAAHRGALAAGGSTVAVIPSGLDAITPRHHAELAETIAERGALVSECASGPPWGKGAFVERNRLIAAMAAATVVVEAAEGSGALITAADARRMGRPVLAVPGSPDRITSRGANDLIRHGAALCERAGDVLAAIGGETTPRTERRAPVVPASPAFEATHASRVLGALGRDAITADKLARAAGLSLPETLAALLQLEWAGVATAEPGQRWSRAS